MKLNKLTTLLVVESIEACLPTWQSLGYAVQVRVPEAGTLDFAILSSEAGELMLQTRRSLKDDLPDVDKLRPSHLLYADVASLDQAKKALPRARVIVSERSTFYGAKEAWLELEDGCVLGLAEHA
ncbi:MAG: hypothetical protein QM756_25140 [Polyangiaceae bacterium]